jgi:hypothetical protein
VVVILAVAGGALGTDAAPTKTERPVGTWEHPVEDGSTWTLVVEQKSLTFKGTMHGNRTVTLTAPGYEVSEEGVLFGYIREMAYTQGENTSNAKGIFPFAFRLKAAEGNITISDLSMRGVDAAGHAGLSGIYVKQADRNATVPAKEVKR